jgi:hypothetical protein
MIIPPWAYLAGGALALTAAFGTGWTVRGWRCDAQIASIERQLQEARDKAQDRADQSSTTYEADRAAQVVVARDTVNTVREIFRDIPAPPAECVPPADATSLLDSAIARTGTDTGEP